MLLCIIDMVTMDRCLPEEFTSAAYCEAQVYDQVVLKIENYYVILILIEEFPPNFYFPKITGN
jgi:hypothetical protein